MASSEVWKPLAAAVLAAIVAGGLGRLLAFG